jgi:hypothetical protein
MATRRQKEWITQEEPAKASVIAHDNCCQLSLQTGLDGASEQFLLSP